MVASALDGLYLDFNMPLSLANALLETIQATQADPNTPQILSGTAGRLWVSQPRPGNDNTIEVLTVNFKLPLSISEVGWEALRVNSRCDMYYMDREDNWRPLLDEARNAVTLNLSASAASSWYKAHFFCYPIVAKSLQFRISRFFDPVVGNQPYPVGLRNGLIRRNVYEREDGSVGMEPQQDILGNTFTTYIKDWDAAKAFDDKPTTFWRSAPQASPLAVCSLYEDMRAQDGSAQLMDGVWMDPVYTGQPVNIYYSNDDTVGTRKLSPISAVATTDENTMWRLGAGRWDISNADGGTSEYAFPMAWGPLVNQDAWIGIEWSPDFDPSFSNATQVVTIGGAPTGGTFTLTHSGQTTTAIAFNATATTVQNALIALSNIGIDNVEVSGSNGGPYTVVFLGALGGIPVATMSATGSFIGGSTPTVTVNTAVVGGEGGGPSGGPATDPVLFEVINPAPGAGQYYPKIHYDVGAAEVVLTITNDAGPTTRTVRASLDPLFSIFDPVRIVAGWTYDPPTLYVGVANRSGRLIGTQTDTNPAHVPSLFTLDGSIHFSNFRGRFTAHVIKLENYAGNGEAFQANPQVYVSPDPVTPDNNGDIPSTSLDNAIYAAAWVTQEHGTGGSHDTHYSEKIWTPIWVDYLTQRGRLFFPQQISAKYLQYEFTNLREEPYPVYDSGVRTTYRTFPVSVSQTQTQGNPGLLQVGQTLAGIGSTLLGNAANSLLQGNVGAAVNWLQPASINQAVSSAFGPVINPISVTVGAGFNTRTLPNTKELDLDGLTRDELSSPYVYRRSPLDPEVLAANLVRITGIDPGIQQLAHAGNVIGGAIANAFTPLDQFVATNVAALPSMGADFWTFPGGLLSLPSGIMDGLTAISEVILGRPPTTTDRLRFGTASIHRYDVRTVTRDAAVAYFVGIREIQPYVTTYIDGQDPDQFVFSQYNASQWVLSNIRQLDSGPITTSGAVYKVLNPDFDKDIGDWIATQGTWSFDGTLGHWYLGTAKVTADGTTKTLQSSLVDVVTGAHIDATVWVKWAGLTATNSSTAIQLQAIYYNNGSFVSSQFQGLTYNPWPSDTPEIAGNHWQQITALASGSTGFTVPSSVNQMRLGLVVTSAASAGDIWFDTVEISTPDTTNGTATNSFVTTSTFARLKMNFTDSGLVLSDNMWAQADQNDSNISSSQLAYYATTIPDEVPAGMWGDTFADWSDQNIAWGTKRAVVSINVDPNRIFQGKRVLHFTRAGGPEEAGIKVRQVTNFVPKGMFRLGCTFYKPLPNGNQITIRLRRVSDGVYIGPGSEGEWRFTPVVGYWYTYVTEFFEVPDSPDQVYTVEMVLSGDDPDEVYLNDLYVEISHIRYRCRLGAIGAHTFDVTDLRYTDNALVSCTTPVNEFLIQADIKSPKAWCYGGTFTPTYLK